jgi:TolA-binding protein
LINRDSFHKEITILKQDQKQKGEEIKQLKEQLKKLEITLDDDRDNDLNYDSSDNESNRENDINYDSECSNNEGHNNRTSI